MNILLITFFFVGFMVSEIPRVSVFGYFPLCRYIFTAGGVANLAKQRDTEYHPMGVARKHVPIDAMAVRLHQPRSGHHER